MNSDDTIPADEFYTDEEIVEMCAKQEQAEFNMLRERAERDAAQAEQDDDECDEDPREECRREYYRELHQGLRSRGLL